MGKLIYTKISLLDNLNVVSCGNWCTYKNAGDEQHALNE